MKNRLYIFILLVLVLTICSCSNKKVFVFAHEDHSIEKLSKAAIVMEKTSKRVLFEHDIHKKLPMASTTKIFTAIVVIENNKDLNKVIEIPKEAVGVGGTSIYLREGEHLSIKELLYGLMLASGNDAACALAIETSGSTEKFANLCNSFCKKIGAKNTQLRNPHGLPDDEHWTTAYDLALVSSYALNNPIFASIVSTTSYEIPNEKGKEKTRVLKNKNRLLKDFEGATGIKTGYTKKAGRCLVSSAKRDGMELVCVVLNCVPMFDESVQLLDTAFEKFQMIEVLEPYTHLGKIEVSCGDKNVVNVFSKDGLFLPLSDSEKDKIRVVTTIPEKLTAPVHVGDKIGEICVSIENDLIFSEKVFTMEESKSTRYFDVIKRIILNF